MSSKRQAERLTTEVMRGLLLLLARSSATRRQSVVAQRLYQGTSRKLSPSMRKALRQKGGVDEFRRILGYLKQRGFIAREGRGAQARITITSNGKEKLADLQFQQLRLEPAAQWDRKWRIVTFDIPEARRPARDALRRLLKEMGFQKLHQSVWVQPFPCRQQILAIQKRYGVHDHITLLEVATFDQEVRFKKLFQDQL